ncbi:prevent-host-death family protein [Devosia enhydra]|uniref:Antitoxin n=1 Tax=Devosia enhydra TaxID=665118 RepID=A0A1K2I1X1_9HYPH|nr:type II toxin-antitoxin system Phd/YefM family antitoxin [Devosia enhydra]SFZ86394.1 prevent-host-death family protein [Devosia enhydra]
MRVSVSEAKGRLTDLVRRAETGDEVILTRHGVPAARIVAIATPASREARRDALEAILVRARRKRAEVRTVPDAPDLYGDDGLPQ